MHTASTCCCHCSNRIDQQQQKLTKSLIEPEVLHNHRKSTEVCHEDTWAPSDSAQEFMGDNPKHVHLHSLAGLKTLPAHVTGFDMLDNGDVNVPHVQHHAYHDMTDVLLWVHALFPQEASKPFS